MLAPWDGKSAEDKERFHKDASKVLRAVADAAGLGKGDFDVVSNKFGPAIAGTVSLYADAFHLWVFQDSRYSSVMARKVSHRKDYVGTPPFENVRLDWELLWSPEKLVEVLRLEGVIL